jgi:hypothetical protein
MTAAILLLFSALSPAPAAAPKPAPIPAPARATPAKAAAASKVWTNDDLQALESTGEISIVGQPEAMPTIAPAASPQTPGAAASTTTPAQTALAPAAPYVKEQDPNWYAQVIDSRRDQIDQIDSQIQEIQQIRATGEGISDAIPLDKTAPGITPEATIEVLQDQKSQLESDIDGMQDLAQSNSIERDAWR